MTLPSSPQEDHDGFVQKLRALIQNFENAFAANPNLSHEDIHRHFVDELLRLLGWTLDAASYQLQRRLPEDARIPDPILTPH